MYALNVERAGTPDENQDAVLLAVIGMDSHELAPRCGATDRQHLR
jgi:hypothetical protein